MLCYKKIPPRKTDDLSKRTTYLEEKSSGLGGEAGLYSLASFEGNLGNRISGLEGDGPKKAMVEKELSSKKRPFTSKIGHFCYNLLGGGGHCNVW